MMAVYWATVATGPGAGGAVGPGGGVRVGRGAAVQAAVQAARSASRTATGAAILTWASPRRATSVPRWGRGGGMLAGMKQVVRFVPTPGGGVAYSAVGSGPPLVY